MVIYADRCEMLGWGEFWVGVLDAKLVFLRLPPENPLQASASSVQDVPMELEQFAEKWGLSLTLKSTLFTEEVWAQLRQYLDGIRKEFNVPTQLFGTAFQVRVWQELLAIPWGRIRTYGDMGASLGNRGLARAVGQANSRNPISIIVPCHRVVAQDGLGGYSGGLSIKQRLLKIEGVI